MRFACDMHPAFDEDHLCELCDEPCDSSRDMELPDGSFVHQACAEQENEMASDDHQH